MYHSGTKITVVGEERTTLDLRKSVTPQPTIFAGEDLTYALTVTNAGPIIAARARLEDATPSKTTFVSATAPPGWTITQQPPVGGMGSIIFEKSKVPLDSQAFLSVLRNV